MRILQLIQKKQLRGAEIFACQLSQQLIQNGHEVRIIALQDGEAILPFSTIELLKVNTQLPVDWFACRKLHQLIRKWQPDVIQANAGDTVRTAVFSKLLFGWKVPIVMRNASTISRYITGGFKKRFYQFLVHRVSAVASVSDVSKADFISLFPHAASKIHLLPIGINVADFTDAITPVGFSNYILHVGGFTFEKNHLGLLEIFEQVLRHQPDALLVCAGDGPLFPEVKNLITQKKLERSVKLLGRRTDVPGLLKGASVLVLPSIIEGLPGIILEAMYAGVPVVAYNTGGIKQVLHADTGWIIEKEHPTIFAETVLNLLTGKEIKKEEKIGHAKRMVEENYTIEQVSVLFEQLYQKLIA